MITNRSVYLQRSITGFSALVLALTPVGCSKTPVEPPDGGGGGGGGVPTGYTLAETVDPHVVALVAELRAAEDNASVVAWAGDTLLPEDYDMALRSSAGVLAGYMGNDLDRCRFVRELLSELGISNRFAVDGQSCKVEAWIDQEATHVPTSRFDKGPIPADWTRTTSIADDAFHRIEILERMTQSAPATAQSSVSETSLGTWTVPELSSLPVIGDYVEQGGGIHFRLRLGRGDDRLERFGGDVTDLERHELVFRYVVPGQDSIDYTRILFDRTAGLANQSPTSGSDVYALWFGSSVIGEPYLRMEETLTDLSRDDAETGDVLYLRAAQLAMETDNAAWQLFENSDQQAGWPVDGGFFFDGVRIVIAAQEQRFDGYSGLTPSLDLVANTRRILGSSDPVAARFALGLFDAMVEGAVLERTTGKSQLAGGSSGVTVPDIFAAMYQEQPDDPISRAELFEDALRRLQEEGVTEEGLLFYDEFSEAAVEVALVGTDLLLVLADDQVDQLAALAPDRFGELSPAVDGLVLGAGSERSWPIALLMLEQGAALNYTPRIEHRESPQTALATATGTHLQGSGTYLGRSTQINAIARRFEEADAGGDPATKRDASDWHLFDDSSTLVGSGDTGAPTPSLDENNPRILQWGEEPSTVSFYESPLWVAPAVAASIRSKLPTECRITYDTGTASDWVAVTFTQFADSRTTVSIDGQPVGIHTIVASDEAQQHELTIALNGLTRLILALRTPNGESRIESIVTPRSLRLRGRVASYRQPLGATQAPTYAVGVPGASINSAGQIDTTWPDGAVDLRVADTSQPTLIGGIGLLIDTSSSMSQPADPACAEDCTSKIDVVAHALGDITQSADEGIELAVWGFPSNYDGSCDTEARELAGWSLSRVATEEAVNSLTEAHLTGGTPLTGAVRAALNNLQEGAWGISRRLIVLADGDNDCDAGLEDVSVPDDVEVHTIGVGLSSGGAAELQLMDLAGRGGGTYTRTTGVTDLVEALTTVAALPLAAPVARSVSTQIDAEGYVSKAYEFPVDQNDVVVYLDRAPDVETPEFVVIQPGESFPSERVSVDASTMALIERHRAARPGITVVMPDRLVDVGGWPGAFGWLEIDADTGETIAVTNDGLRGAGGVVYWGATVLGLWSGALAVIDNFSGCVLSPNGCGGDIVAIRETICSTSGWGPTLGAIYVSFLATVFTGANGFLLDESYTTGLAVVNGLCSTEADLTEFVMNTGGNVGSDGIGSAFGGAVGFGYTLLLNLLPFLPDEEASTPLPKVEVRTYVPETKTPW